MKNKDKSKLRNFICYERWKKSKNKYNFDFIVGKTGKGQAFNPKKLIAKNKVAIFLFCQNRKEK